MDNTDATNGYANYPNLDDQGTENLENRKSTPNDTSSQPDSSSLVPESSVNDFNFWKVNCYKKTVKRIDDGSKQCDDLMKMVSERAEIEGQYSAKLQGWSKKWSDLITKGPEYGACKDKLLEFTTEAQQLSAIYSELQNQLTNIVYNSVNSWKSANYHKSLLSWKETKTAEESFTKAQKPWAKKHDEVLKCKKSYYAACKLRDQAEKIYNNSTVESSNMTEEQVKKLKDKLIKCEGDVTSSRDKYKEAIRDITNYNPKYKDDMVYAFDKVQAMEETRKLFVKDTMRSLCKVLDPGQYFERFAGIYDHVSHSIDKFNPSEDISWWSVTYGKDMPITWLEYEEYVANATDVTNQQYTSTQSSEKDKDKEDAKPKGKSTVCATL